MKKISLFFRNMKGNLLKLLILFLTVGAMQLILNYSLSGYLYYNRAQMMFSRAELEGGAYFINITPYDQASLDSLSDTISELKENGAVERILQEHNYYGSLNGKNYQIIFADGDEYKKMYGTLPYGRWGGNDEREIYGVIAGVMPNNVAIGQKETLRRVKKNDSDQDDSAGYEILISGVLSYPPMVFKMSYYSNVDMTADKFFDSREVLYIIANEKEREEIQATLKDQGLNSSGIVLFKDGATEAEKKEIIEKLEQCSEVLMIDDILEKTDNIVVEKLLASISLPSFLLVVTALAYMSICVITINKKKYDYSNYQIVGCSRKTLISMIVAQVSSPVVLSTIIFSVLSVVLKSTSEKGIYTLPNLIFGYENLFLTLCSSIIIVAVVFALTMSLMKKISPLDLLREMDK